MDTERDPGAPPKPETGDETPFGVIRGDRVHEFRGDGILVTWSRARCTHVAACVASLQRVFQPGRRPWVEPSQAPADSVARVVALCPTGALHFARTDGGPAESALANNSVVVARHGPLRVHGDIEILDESGVRRLADTRVALCRCGGSANKPFCDGTHAVAGFVDEGGVSAGSVLTSRGSADRTLRIRLEPEGPLHLEGPFSLASADRRTTISGSEALLCRCGRSQNRPLCDGSGCARVPGARGSS